jgi:hypothetical protein
LPWAAAVVEDDAVIADVNPDRLEELPRDQWPAQ